MFNIEPVPLINTIVFNLRIFYPYWKILQIEILHQSILLQHKMN